MGGNLRFTREPRVEKIQEILNLLDNLPLTK